MGTDAGMEPVAPAWLTVVPLVTTMGAAATVTWWRRAEVVRLAVGQKMRLSSVATHII